MIRLSGLSSVTTWALAIVERPVHVLSPLLMLEKVTKEFCVTTVTVGHMLSVVISVILNMIDYLHNLIVKFGCAHHVPPPVLAYEADHYHIHYFID